MNRWIDVFRLRVRSLFRREAADSELDRELRFHLEHEIAERVAQGISAEEARRTALRDFGSLASVHQQCRETRRVTVIQDLGQDVRYAIRGLIRQPMLLIAAATSIALGIGANLAIFGLANDLLLSTPTAYRADRVVHIRVTNGSHTSHRVWRELRDSRVLAGLAGYDFETDLNWRGTESSITLMPLIVTANFFDVMGVPMALGRGFTADEAAPERDPRLVILSHGFWVRRLGADPAVIGTNLTLNGEPYTILGVLPADTRSLPGYGFIPDVWLPASRALVADIDVPNAGNVQLIGRLQDDQTHAAAHAALAAVAARVGEALGHHDALGIRWVAPVGGIAQLKEFAEIAVFFAVLLIVSMLVLAIACANVAGLLLARSTTRRREIALRLAIGATRSRIVRQLVTEGFVLSVCGAVVGLALTAILGGLVQQISLPLPIPIELRLTFDSRIVMLATGLVFLSTLLCGLAPALQASRPGLIPALKQDTPAYIHRRFTVRRFLVTGQVAVSVLLLVMTLLFLRNLSFARGAAPGFDAERLVMMQVTFVDGRQGVADAPAVTAMVERLRSMAGVQAASFADGVPLTMRFGGTVGTDIRIEGQTQDVRVEYHQSAVAPAYFQTMGIPILRGRDFSASDRKGGPRVVIVNQEFVRRYFAGQDPIGRQLFLPGPRDQRLPTLVIGVAGDSKYRTIGEDQAAAMYFSALHRNAASRFMHILVRTFGPPEAMTTPLRDAVLAEDPSAAVTAEPMTSGLAFAFLPSRVGAILVGALGLLGALLAMVGLYGVVSFAVSRRTAEIGIRLALGATRAVVMRLILREGLVLVGSGLVVGLFIAFFITRPLSAFLVAGLAPSDPASFLGSAVLLLVTSLAASWYPARRAARVEAAVALRAE